MARGADGAAVPREGWVCVARVLIVEDDRGVGAALAQVLELGGCEVETAFDGLAGLQRLRTQPPPDLLLLDLALPGLSGRELLERLADDARLRQLPVVVMTATRQPALLPPAGTYRALLYKPFEVDEVLRLVADMELAAGAR
jgi:CheY-like chemotaxis protein